MLSALISKRVALDSNMLLAIQQFKVDVFNQIKELEGRIQFIIPWQVLAELKAMEKQGLALKKAVSVARQAMEKQGVKKVKVEAKNADKALLKLAGQGVIIATNDRELKKEIKKINGSIMFLRKKKLIEKE